MKIKLHQGNSILLLIIALSFISVQVPAQVKSKSEIIDTAKAKAKHISIAQLKQKIKSGKDFFFIDVRTEKEYLAGHIGGALWIPRGKLEFGILGLTHQADADIVLYCRSGARSSLAALALNKMGFIKTVDLKGGFKHWVEEGNTAYNMHGEFKVVNYLKKTRR